MDWQPIETAPKDGRPIYVIGVCPAHGTYEGPAHWNGFYWHKLHRNGFVNMKVFPVHWGEIPATPEKG